MKDTRKNTRQPQTTHTHTTLAGVVGGAVAGAAVSAALVAALLGSNVAAKPAANQQTEPQSFSSKELNVSTASASRKPWRRSAFPPSSRSMWRHRKAPA